MAKFEVFVVRKELFAKPWAVFCKAPFSNRNIVLEYIGRYSHRVAISNSRIKNIDSAGVTFDYKDLSVSGITVFSQGVTGRSSGKYRKSLVNRCLQ